MHGGRWVGCMGVGGWGVGLMVENAFIQSCSTHSNMHTNKQLNYIKFWLHAWCITFTIII